MSEGLDETAALAAVRGVLREMMPVGAAADLDGRTPIEDFGLDSLAILALLDTAEQRVGTRLGTDFDYSSLRTLGDIGAALAKAPRAEGSR